MPKFPLFIQNSRKKNSKQEYDSRYMEIMYLSSKTLKRVLKNSFVSSPPSQLRNLHRRKKLFTRISCTKGTNCQLSCTTDASGLRAEYIKESHKRKKKERVLTFIKTSIIAASSF